MLSIEPDGPVTISDAPGTQSPTPSWGLDRIDQRGPVGGSTSYGYPNTGVGVTAYIIDTGVRTTHNDFGGRAAGGYDFVDNDADPADCNGHGTHVAGTVGGATYGVAKGVTIVPVRVLDCSGSGTWSGVIAGINWVTASHAAGAPAVANMSLGGGANSAVDAAIEAAIADGVTFAVAAGNNSLNACNYSPARTPSAFTVGATTSSDARASYSNYGSCLDIFAPGSSITSDWSTSNTATSTLNGTSMATPHVAGAAALYLATNPGASPATVTSALLGAATNNAISNAGSGSPNSLLFMGTSAPAPTTGSITGQVTAQANGAAISGATVMLDSGQATTTNDSGDYTLVNVPTGARTVTASRSGFVTSAPTAVTVNAGATSTLNIALASVPACTATVTSDSDSSNRGGTVTINWTNGPGVTQVQVQRRLTSSIWSTQAIWSTGQTTFSGSDSTSDPQWRLVPRCAGIDYPGAAFDPS